MATLYVTEPGAQLEKEYQHLLVTLNDETILRVPLAHVSHVVLVGQGVSVTTPALHTLLAAGVTLSLVRATGELVGRLTPPSGKNLELRRRQYARGAEPEFCLNFSRQVVTGKLHNYRALALRWLRSRRTEEAAQAKHEALLQQLAESARQAAHAADLATLRGLEGAGSRAYFAIFRDCLRATPGESDGQNGNRALVFAKRTRQPPRDPINALLSLGYTLLGEAAATALEVVGLDPYEGFFHADKYGRPALALDLMEELRGPVADSVVLTLVNKRMLKPADFTEPTEEGGVYLRPAGLRLFLREFSERLQSTFTHPLAGRPLTYQKCLEVQARQIARLVMGESDRYRPLRAR